MGILMLILYMEERGVRSFNPGSMPSKLWCPSVKIRCPRHQAKGGFTVRPLLVVCEKLKKKFKKTAVKNQTEQRDKPSDNSTGTQ